MNEDQIRDILKKEIRKVLQEQGFSVPGVNWGSRRQGRADRVAGGDLEAMEKDAVEADAADGLSRGQRKAYNAAVASAAQDSKEQVDALRSELTEKFRTAIAKAIEDTVERIIDPEIDQMRQQYSDTFQLIFQEIQREFAKAQEELDQRMKNVASQYLMKRDAPSAVRRQLKKQSGQ